MDRLVDFHDVGYHSGRILRPDPGRQAIQLSVNTAEESLRTRFVLEYWDDKPDSPPDGDELSHGLFFSPSAVVVVTPLLGEREAALGLPAPGNYRYTLNRSGTDEVLDRSDRINSALEEDELEEEEAEEMLKQMNGLEVYTLRLWGPVPE